MEDKLVTLAILTYAKAQILKNVLENEGIEAYIHNVNLIQPVISVKGRCLVFILSAMTLRRIASQLPMMPRIGRGLPWELFWRRNIHPGMKDY